MSNIPQPATVHDRRNLIPPDPANWENAEMIRTDRDADGTWRAILTLGSTDYWVRAYRAEGGAVRFQFQPRRCADAEASWLAYLDGLERRIAG